MTCKPFGTHHHACDCREEQFVALESENAALKTELDLQKAITVEAKRCPICRCEEGAYHIQNCIFMDRDRWKALCEKMAEVVKASKMLIELSWFEFDTQSEQRQKWCMSFVARSELIKALALYDAEQGKGS